MSKYASQIPSGGGIMIYPMAGIPISTGVGWNASITNNSTNWNTAYGWGNHAGLYLGLHGTADAVSGLTITAGASISNSNTGDQTLSGLGGQPALSGTGFIKASGTTISYDNSSYLTTSTALSTYAPLASPTFTVNAAISAAWTPALKLVSTGHGTTWEIHANALDANDFGIYQNSSATYPLFIKANKNVGIDTTAPSEKLHVVGNGIFTGSLKVYSS